MGTALACRSMWMSAPLDLAALSTMDFRGELSIVELDQEDRTVPGGRSTWSPTGRSGKSPTRSRQGDYSRMLGDQGCS